MIECDDFVQALEGLGCNFFTGVPDTILGGIIEVLAERRLYTPAVREDEAVAMVAGAFLGKNPCCAHAKFRVGECLERVDVAESDLHYSMRHDYFLAGL